MEGMRMFGAQYGAMGAQPVNSGYMDPYSARLAALQQPQQTQQLPRYEIIQVNGENGARAFRMAPNSRCLLLDETNPIVWLAQTDGAGYPTLTPYSITPYKPEPQQAPGSDLNERLSKLEAIIYGKSNPAADQPADQQPAGTDTNVGTK